MKLPTLYRALLGLAVTAIGWQANAACTTTAWSSSTTYKGGELVIYQNAEYKARYWINPGKIPNPSDPWDAWQFTQACSGTQTSSSKSSVATSVASGNQCNWYGSVYSICTQTTSGWGWENSKSCIALADCSKLTSPNGVIGNASTSSSVVSSCSPSYQNLYT